MVKEGNNNTEERIFEAAKKIFFRDGLQGARMQDIADLAQINRAMLHYYFRNKETLSEQVMKTLVSKFIEAFKANLNSELSFEKKIDFYITQEIELVYNNSELFIFALHEAGKDMDFFKKIIPDNKPSTIFRKQIKEAYENGEIITKDVEDFVVMVSSLCMFPFIAGPLYMMIFKWDENKWGIFRRYLRRKLPVIIKQALFKGKLP
jgi:TetR/AcrR family transcriptional regulator